MGQSPFPMEKKRLVGLVAVLSFGLTSLFAVLSLGPLVAPTFVAGFLILLPLLAILGDDLSIVEDAGDTADEDAGVETTDPVDRLRERYAAGEISEEEFEQKLERLLQTEDLERAAAGGERQRERAGSERDRSVELE